MIKLLRDLVVEPDKNLMGDKALREQDRMPQISDKEIQAIVQGGLLYDACDSSCDSCNYNGPG